MSEKSAPHNSGNAEKLAEILGTARVGGCLPPREAAILLAALWRPGPQAINAGITPAKHLDHSECCERIRQSVMSSSAPDPAAEEDADAGEGR